MAHHRDAGVLLDVADEGVGAARHQQVDVAVAREHRGDVLARLQQRDPVRRDAGGGGGGADRGEQGAVGAERLAAALEEAGVAALEAERGDLDEGVGAGLEDDADDAEGAGGALEDEAGRELGAELEAADGVGERSEGGEAFEEAVELAGVERKAGGERRVEPLRGGGGEVLAVGGVDLLRAVAEAGRHRGERGVADLGGGPGEGPGGGARGAGEFGDVHGGKDSIPPPARANALEFPRPFVYTPPPFRANRAAPPIEKDSPMALTVKDMKGRKIGICVSGGLDSKTIATRLREAGADVLCFTADLGQPDEKDIRDVQKKMEPCGVKTVIVDVRKPMAEACFRAIKAQATYDGGYWNSTGIGRAVTTREIVKAMKRHGIDTLVHGATGRGNDQMRFERYTNQFAPEMEVYAPWRDASLLKEFPGRRRRTSRACRRR